jgi:hypothetical protein
MALALILRNKKAAVAPASLPKGNIPNMTNDGGYQKFLETTPDARAPRPGMRFLDRYFTEPMAFARGSLPGLAGVYAVLVSDPGWQPRPYRPIYFGAAENLEARVVTSHEQYEEWLQAAGAEGNLYTAYHLMSGDETQRKAFEKNLIQEYKACDETANDSPSLAGGDSHMQESFG